MKTINYKLALMLSLMVIALTISCKKDSTAAKPEPSSFSATLEGGVATVPAAGGILNIVISAGTDGWWITTAQADWVITKMFGSGNFKLPVTVKANTSGAARVITINVNPTFNLPAVTFNINQDK